MDVDLGFLGETADVFTLFPQWFDWFATQRHVENASRSAMRSRRSTTAPTTPLSGGRSTTRRSAAAPEW